MPLFTPQNARENAAKAQEARRRHAAEREAMRNTLPETPQAAPLTAPQNQRADDYSSKRLLRVRAQLDRLDEMMSTETDPQ